MGKKILIALRSIYISCRLLINNIKESLNNFFTVLSAFACITVIILLLIDFATKNQLIRSTVMTNLHEYLLFFFCIDILIRVLITAKNKWSYFIVNPTQTAIFIVVAKFVSSVWVPYHLLTIQVALLLILFGRITHLKALLNWFKVKPTQLLILSFLFVIFIGSILLSLPISSQSSQPIEFIDALFTAFSAVCVTGLTVNTISDVFSIYGQVVILCLIQVGGLGIMSFSALLTLLLRKRMTPVTSIELQQNYDTFNLKETVKSIKFIFKFTLFFELIGTVLLTYVWYEGPQTLVKVIYYALFHSISAFCNAGFSLFDNSLMNFATHVPVTLIISGLIIFGGLGFPVLYNLFQMLDRNNTHIDLKIQTKIALRVTGLLIVIGTVWILCSEYTNALSHYAMHEKVLISFFQSVSARTAGFNSIDLTSFNPASYMCLIILMIIGASPGSTGGGMKTTAFGIMAVSFWNVIRSSFRMDICKKTLCIETVLKSFALLVLIVILILGTFISLVFLETIASHKLFFEIVSAFGTVGFSLGATIELSNVSKMIIMVVMFVGRIGPFTFIYAFLKRKKRSKYAYPIEKYNFI